MPIPCIVFEDDDVLVINKPAGLNTHAPDPYAGEGIYDWLRHRERRWASLGIIHRLDKETSGLIVFAKSKVANRSLTEQFTKREVHKKYVLLTDRPFPGNRVTARSSIARAGERYVSRPGAGSDFAETRFNLTGPCDRVCSEPGSSRDTKILQAEAQPLTGRTHQIRVQAADHGFPILGDVLYGGTRAERVFLHAGEIAFRHPNSTEEVSFRTDPDWEGDPRLTLRRALIEPDLTDSFRLINGASDGWPGWNVDKLGPYLLAESETGVSEVQLGKLEAMAREHSSRGVFHKHFKRQIRRTQPEAASPRLLFGEAPEGPFRVRENGVEFELTFSEGYSVGIFLDQRENRRRLLTRYVGQGFPILEPAAGKPPEVLNTFAYTCAFSVCAAKAGARVTSLDLSRKYLEWGRRNFELNRLDPAAHDFIYGDVFDWLKRLARKGRQFEVVLLDPPTFSQSRQSGVFRAEKDYAKLVTAALPLIARSGVLFASSNAAGWPPREFVAAVRNSVTMSRRKILNERYCPQPPDFPISRPEPAYLKTLWLQLD